VRRHAPLLGLILLGVAALYANVSGAGFCGYDDFHEAYRAAFFDGRVPSRILTAAHYEQFMYRPVTSALQLATWQLFGHDPVAFRLRNLAMHLLATALVYGIAFLLGRSRAAAAGAALLFGFSPLANEAVVVAIWTNTTAYALALASFFLFLLALDALDAGGHWALELLGSFGLGELAMFTYEPTIVVLGMMLAYLAICRSGRAPISRAFALAFAAGCAVDLVFFFAVRHLLGITAAALLPAGEILRDMVEYLVALALPVDLVLQNALFAVPLPVSGQPVPHSTFVLPALYAIVVLIAFALCLARPVRLRLADADWPTLGFLLVSIPLVLVPIVLYKAHVSEFNLYVPAALYAMLVALVLAHFCRNRTAFAAVLGLLLLSSLLGSWVRNGRVVACAQLASTILSGLPLAAWRDGDWYVRLATSPGERLKPRYGIYNYSGIKAIEVSETPIKGAQEAVRLATGNDRVRVDVVSAPALERGCGRPETCFYVAPSGDVKEVVGR